MARIGIDVRKWSDFGIGSYLQGLVPALLDAGGDDEYVLFARPAEAIRLALPGRRWRAVPVKARPYSPGEMLAMRRWSASEELDLFHEPHYTLSPWISGPAVVTIHDLIHITMPGSALRLGYARTVMGQAVRRAARVIVPSQHTKRELLRLFPAAAGRVRVIPHGLLAAPDSRRPSDLPHDYLLFVGSERPYKNLDGVLRAFALLVSRYQGMLVVAGLPLPPSARLLASVRELGLAGRLHWAGYRDAAEMPALFAGARVLLAPSLEEGFGLQVLEGMAAGTPVVTSREGATAELAADGALLVDPRDPAAVAEAAARILDDPDAAAQLSRRGRARADAFRWADAARATRDVYREALA